MKRPTLKGLWEVLKKSGAGFFNDKVLKLSASLGYYTVFSFAPMLVVILFLAGIILKKEVVEGSIYEQLAGFVGPKSAIQLQEVIRNAAISNESHIAATIGIIVLLVTATTVFAEIQDSINDIWGLKTKPGKGFVQLVKARLLSFGIIVVLGFLLLVSLGVSTVLDALNQRLMAYFPDVTIVLFYILNLLVNFIVTAVLFAFVFKVLPDARINWKDVTAGAIATTILFMLGKFAISFYISKSDIGGTYGAAGSLAILLVWVYYSAMILYFGAEFTKAYAIKYGRAIYPNKYAVITRKLEVEEKGTSTVQSAERKTEIETSKDGVNRG